jgi:hypothetical protein
MNRAATERSTRYNSGWRRELLRATRRDSTLAGPLVSAPRTRSVMPFKNEQEEREQKVANAVHVSMLINLAHPDATVFAGHPKVAGDRVTGCALDYMVNLGPWRQHSGAAVLADDLGPVTSTHIRIKQERRMHGASSGIREVNGRFDTDALLTVRDLARGQPAYEIVDALAAADGPFAGKQHNG